LQQYSENNVKRLWIKSHYLFVANAAVWSCMSGGFAGLNGSQATEISIATFFAYPTSAGDLAGGELRYLHLFSL
jgi:hypothetical protein